VVVQFEGRTSGNHNRHFSVKQSQIQQLVIVGVVAAFAAGCSSAASAPPPWEADNPVVAVPKAPLGAEIDLAALAEPPTPERVRLGRWLFYDRRLSADNSVACATCHRPDHAFSEPTAVSTGIGGQKGRRKAPSLVNQADALLPHFFWDGRAGSLEDQALGPIGNPIEMGMNDMPDALAAKISGIAGYKPYFRAAFGTDAITGVHIAKAIVAYEQTRMSGNSAWDRWRYERDESAVSDQVKQGHELFFGKAKCRQCHAGNNFTDSKFHNIGIGWDPVAKKFSDEGRLVVTKSEADRGSFKTPTLRDVTRHSPYAHDGSIATLREVVELYNRGGHKNPYLDVKIEPLGLSGDEVDAIVAFLQSLEGEGYQDKAPSRFPQ
jgi:cytochrome c peroxidase